ncbi:MAG TPA: RNHCP domain-containing protein [Patescibacteria group bacterium]|nr:RNHCP domain-containing protein [Patescibacteria group bacterium]
MSSSFIRQKENFVCENCGQKVQGDGYTNHCPKCLFSKHVDINPGDRLNMCQGLMKPKELAIKHGRTLIVHQCVRCKTTKKNISSKNDNLEVLTYAPIAQW